MDYEIQARKLPADARLGAATGTRPEPESMTKEQIATTVTAISDLMQALRNATTEDKAEIYPDLKTGTRQNGLFCATEGPVKGVPSQLSRPAPGRKDSCAGSTEAAVAHEELAVDPAALGGAEELDQVGGVLRGAEAAQRCLP